MLKFERVIRGDSSRLPHPAQPDNIKRMTIDPLNRLIYCRNGIIALFAFPIMWIHKEFEIKKGGHLYGFCLNLYRLRFFATLFIQYDALI